MNGHTYGHTDARTDRHEGWNSDVDSQTLIKVLQWKWKFTENIRVQTSKDEKLRFKYWFLNDMVWI